MVSMEFWYGTLVSGALFIIGSVISIFGADVRSYHLTWRKNRKLRGNALKIRKLQDDLSQHQRLANDSGAAAAYFWSGLFLVLTVLMLLGLIGFMNYQIQSASWRSFGAALFAIAWLMAYTVAIGLHRRAQALRRPAEHSKELSQKISSLQSELRPN